MEKKAASTITLNGKILAVKSSIGKISKDGSSVVGGGRKIKYATLPMILEKVVPILNENNLDYQITCVLNSDTLPLLAQNIRVFSLNFVDTESGEKSEPIMFPFRVANLYMANESNSTLYYKSSNGAEAIKSDGSTITYATRYLLGMALGLQTEEDPDAKFPQQTTQTTAQTKKIRTFEECKAGFYNCLNSGNIEGAKKTVAFIETNFKDKTAEITEMKAALI